MLARCCSRSQMWTVSASIAHSSVAVPPASFVASRSLSLLSRRALVAASPSSSSSSSLLSHRHLSSVAPPAPAPAAPASSSASTCCASPLMSPADAANDALDLSERAGPEITEALINSYADKKARSVSVLEMIEMGSNPAFLLTAAQWLWTELPVRLAKRLRDLDDLPFGLSKSAEVRRLARLYTLSLQDALAFPQPTNSAEEAQFTEQVLKRILVRHQSVTVDLASGINGGFLGKSAGTGGGTVVRPLKQHFLLQEFLDRWNSARIGLRLLMSQHVALHSPREGFVGVIELQCDPARVVSQAIEDASAVCRAWNGVVPRVEVHDTSAAKGGIRFSYVTAHLRCMLFELLKNAMKATVEQAQRKRTGAAAAAPLTEADLPPITVVLVDSTTPSGDVTIKVSDRGGGIKRADLPLVFTYTFSATQKSIAQQQLLQSQMRQAAAAAVAQTHAATGAAQAAAAIAEATGSPVPRPVSPLAGTPLSAATRGPEWVPGGGGVEPVLNAAHSVDDLGEAFGLPITRLYARYLGGDLQLYSLAGHGTDAYLFLNKTHSNFHEVIQD